MVIREHEHLIEEPSAMLPSRRRSRFFVNLVGTHSTSSGVRPPLFAQQLFSSSTAKPAFDRTPAAVPPRASESGTMDRTPPMPTRRAPPRSRTHLAPRADDSDHCEGEKHRFNHCASARERHTNH